MKRWWENITGTWQIRIPDILIPPLKISSESFTHARIYAEVLKYAEKEMGLKSKGVCKSVYRYIHKISNQKEKCSELSLGECLLPEEEILMYVYAQPVLESCKFIPENLRVQVKRILQDELRHNRIIRSIKNLI